MIYTFLIVNKKEGGQTRESACLGYLAKPSHEINLFSVTLEDKVLCSGPVWVW